MKVFAQASALLASASTANAFLRQLGDSSNLLFEIMTNRHGSTDFADDKAAKHFLDNHGCYCHPVKSKNVGPHGDYNGPALDELDLLCKKFWQSQRCISEGCDKDTDFTAAWDGSANQHACVDADACASEICALEIDFNERVGQLIATGYVQDEALASKTEAEYSAICTEANTAARQGPKNNCCGSGIERKTYNDIMFDCCSDGSIKTMGTCQ